MSNNHVAVIFQHSSSRYIITTCSWWWRGQHMTGSFCAEEETNDAQNMPFNLNVLRAWSTKPKLTKKADNYICELLRISYWSFRVCQTGAQSKSWPCWTCVIVHPTSLLFGFMWSCQFVQLNYLLIYSMINGLTFLLVQIYLPSIKLWLVLLCKLFIYSGKVFWEPLFGFYCFYYFTIVSLIYCASGCD